MRAGPSQSSGVNDSGQAPAQGSNGAGKLADGAAKSTGKGRPGLNGSAALAPAAVSGEGKLEQKDRVEERVAEPIMEHRMNIIMWCAPLLRNKGGLGMGMEYWM